MGDWEKFWNLIDQEIPEKAIHPAMPDRGVFGDYLAGQYVIHRANQICREAGLSWRAVKLANVHRIDIAHRYYIVVVELEVQVSDGVLIEGRPGLGIGRAIAPFDKTTGEFKPVTAQQIDTAEKSAWSDALKNAWSKFGRALGGELYFNENDAMLLGWEIESDKVTQRSSEDPAEQADLGQTVLTYGWGKEKKWQGWTFEQVYGDDDGRSAMAWCFEDKSRQGSWANKMFARYYEFRKVQEKSSQDQAPLAKEPISTDRITYERAVAINNLLRDKVGPGKLFGHTNHVTNHLKVHFNCAKVIDLSEEKANAFVKYVAADGKDKDPKYYKAAEEEKAELFGQDYLETLLKECATKLPKEWQDDPVGWLGLYGIKPPLNSNQFEGLRILVELIRSGAFDLATMGKDSVMAKVFEEAMGKVASNGTMQE